MTTTTTTTDERLIERSLLTQLLNRPELGSVAGALAVWIFFAVTAGRSFLSLAR